MNVSGKYGDDGSVYTTEKSRDRSSFVRIVARGSMGYHPEGFDAITRDGRVMSFGQNRSAQVKGRTHAAVHTWLLDKVEDTQGEKLFLKYDFSDYKYLLSITSKEMAVIFSYKPRRDHKTLFFDGGIIYKMDKVIKDITIKGFSSIRLLHAESGSARLSLVTGIAMYNGKSECIRLTNFSYQGLNDFTGYNAMTAPSIWTDKFGKHWKAIESYRYVVDINADGLNDFIGFVDDGTYGSFNTNGKGMVGYLRGEKAGGFVVGRSNRYIIDMNGDDLVDVVAFGEQHVCVSINGGLDGQSLKLTPTIWSSEFGASQGFDESLPTFVKDVNADGLPDIFCYGKDAVYIALNTGANFSKAFTVKSSMIRDLGWDNQRHVRFLEDVNGDGLPDMVGIGQDGVYVALNINGTSFMTMSRWSTRYGHRWGNAWSVLKHPRYVEDVDGDGLKDVVGFADEGVFVSINNGSGFSKAALWHKGFGSSTGIWAPDNYRGLYDMNGDDLLDVVAFSCCGVIVALNTGSSFANLTVWTTEHGSNGRNPVADFPTFIIDMDGDGVCDIVGCTNNGVLVTLNKNRKLTLVAVRVVETPRKSSVYSQGNVSSKAN